MNTIDALIEKQRNGKLDQAEYNTERLQAFIDAKKQRPHFVQVVNELPGVASTIPVKSEPSDKVEYDLILTGAISDAEDRDGNFYRKAKEDYFVNSKDYDSRLTFDAVAGKSVAAAGFPGVADFPEPFELQANQSITVELYQDTAVADIVNTVFCGVRVFDANSTDAQLKKREIEQINHIISVYDSPQTRYLNIPVEFKNGVARTESPEHHEPLLVLGFQADFTDAKINIGFSTETSFSTEPFPIWALCAEPKNNRLLYQPLPKPLPLAAFQQLFFNLLNTIDGNLYAPQKGNITMFAKTP